MSVIKLSEQEIIEESQKLLSSKEYDKLLALCDDILSRDDKNLIALNYKGMVHMDLNELDKAYEYLDIAYKIDPKVAYIAQNRIAILNKAGRLEEATAAYAELDESLKNNNYSLGGEFFGKMDIHEWSKYDEYIERIKDATFSGKKACMGFITNCLIDSPALQLKSNAIWMHDSHKENTSLGPINKLARKPKIRIGYYSADYFYHVTMFLMAELFEVHDKDRFEVYAFSFSKHEDDTNARVVKAFDKFIYVDDKTDEEVAKMSRELEIDIAVDLKGLTGGGRPNIFAYRAAPVQINYLGYPGTMPCNYIDYLIADHTIIPSDSRMYYSEKIIYMPDCYQPNDTNRELSEVEYTREDQGLPRNAFVFACFCSVYKINPVMMDMWANILKEVPNSVLWLMQADNKATEPAKVNMLKEAKARGITEGRLIFAERLPLKDHLKRAALADLFLDTIPCNAHTTAADSLWAGLPVLAITGESFAARVSASIVNAAWLPELVARTKEEYVAIAIELGRNPAKLRVFRSRLERNKLICPLFNTKLYARYLEVGYIRAYERYQAGLSPDHIYIGA